MKHNNLRASQTSTLWFNRCNLFKFKSFYDQMNFSTNQHLRVNKSIVELTDLQGGSNLTQRRLRGGNWFKDNDMVFYEKDRQVIPNHHHRPLYMPAYISYVDLISTIVDPGYSLKFMPLSTLETVGIRRDKIIKHSVEVSSFRGNASFTLGFINLDLTVGPMRVANRFRVIDAGPHITCC